MGGNELDKRFRLVQSATRLVGWPAYPRTDQLYQIDRSIFSASADRPEYRETPLARE